MHRDMGDFIFSGGEAIGNPLAFNPAIEVARKQL
jgi:hypothetical protein